MKGLAFSCEVLKVPPAHEITRSDVCVCGFHPVEFEVPLHECSRGRRIDLALCYYCTQMLRRGLKLAVRERDTLRLSTEDT